jgi:hypothetical protein
MVDIARRYERAWLLVWLAWGGCDLKLDTDAPTEQAAPSAQTTEALKKDAGTQAAKAEPVYTHPARRCSECHESYHEEWSTSAHARSGSSEAYAKIRGETDGKGCDSCHRPLANVLGDRDSRAREGVSCDVCHGITHVEPARPAAKWSLDLKTGVRYGPLCDAKDHYFHRMGCSPLHEKSEVCAACHSLAWTATTGATIPVLSEYEEWKASPFAAQDMSCQVCHMPSREAEVAKGAGTRDGVSSHAFLSDTLDLRRDALVLQVQAEASGEDRVRLALQLSNRAGHSLPSGFPGRQVVIQARALNAAGEVTGSAEHVLARTLGDASGKEVPFHRATQVVQDTRIPSRETRKQELELAAPSEGTLVVEARWRKLSPALAQELGGEVDEQVLLSAELKLGPPEKRRRISPSRMLANSKTEETK